MKAISKLAQTVSAHYFATTVGTQYEKRVLTEKLLRIDKFRKKLYSLLYRNIYYIGAIVSRIYLEIYPAFSSLDFKISN